MKFSNLEIFDLTKAWLAIALAFTIVDPGSSGFLITFVISAIAVGSGFLLHELAHKFVAQRYGCWAEFRASDMMLVLCVASSFLGFIFAAPGAVFIMGNLGLRRNAVVSIAGPIVNVILAFLFLLVPFPQLAGMGFFINAWLALFNMIPFFGLDGQKVWAYSPVLWVAFTLVPGLMLYFIKLFV